MNSTKYLTADKRGFLAALGPRTRSVQATLAFLGMALITTVVVLPFIAAEGASNPNSPAAVSGEGSRNQFTNPRQDILAPTQQFCNSSPITIPTSGTASPYPSVISVSGVTGVVGDITVTLNNIQHVFAGDIDILLVGPGGQKFIVLSDTGGSVGFAQPRTITLSDAGADLVPQATSVLPSGTYKPTNRGTTADVFSGVTGPFQSPATFGTSSFSSVFGFADPIGDWKLYVVDDSSFDAGGSVGGGWCMDLNLVAPNPGQLQFETGTYAQDEQAGAKTIPVTRSEGLAGEVTVNYATSNGTATGGTACGAGVDYINSSGTLTFPAGVAAQTFDVAVCNDTDLEDGETVNLSLSNPGGGATLGAPSQAALTITRLDRVCNATPIIIPNIGVASPYPSTITLSGYLGVVNEVKVTLNNFQHSLGSQVDMLLVGSGGQKFVPIANTGGSSGFDNAITLTLADEGTAYVPNSPITGSTYKPTSNSTNPTFLAPAPPEPYGVPGPQTRQVNETFRSVFTGVVPNGAWNLYVYDATEFLGTGSGSIAGGWCLGFTSTTPTPGAAQFVLDASSVFESEGTREIEIRRIGGATGAVTVNYASSGGTATGGAACTAGIDYISANGQVSFADGELGRKTISVQVCRDGATSEGDETIILQLANPTGGLTLGTPATHTLTLGNSFNSLVGIIAPDFAGSDFQAQQVPVQILREAADGVTDSVDYTLTGGTATGGAACSAGVDYINAGGTVTFMPGDFEEFALVSICPDTDAEGDETIELNLANPSTGAQIGTGQDFARITIVDNTPRTFTVNTTNDLTDGLCNAAHCSLREAVISASAAPSADEIKFDPAVFDVGRTITFSDRSLPISNPVTITGPGIGLLTVDGDSGRAFINSSVASISGMRLVGGLGDGGIENMGTLDLTSVRMTAIQPISDFRGALFNNGGTVNITDCLIDNNDGFGTESGLVNVAGGAMNVLRTTIANNDSGTSGGGISNQDSILNVTNSTISGNTCSFQGGGIFVFGGTANINHTTITNNTGDDQGISAGGIENFGSGTVNIRNSIVAGNRGSVENIDVVGAFTSQGFNLIGANNSSTGFTNGVNGDKVGTRTTPLAAMIATLASNGGSTQTHALLTDSPAIDAANPTSDLTTDQRGVTRPQDGDNNGSLISDIGSFELGFAAPSPTPTATPCGTTYFEVEPNDTTAAPQVLTSPDRIELIGRISQTGDNDYYKFDAGTGDRIWAYVYTQGATVSTDSFLALSGPTDTTVAVDTDNGSQAAASSAIAGQPLATAGAYKLRVVDFALDETMEPYTLFVDRTTGAPVPEVEPNEAISAANAYTVGSVVSGEVTATTDSDTFSFTVGAGERLIIQVDSDPERDGTQFNPNLRVIDNTGAVLVTVDDDTASCFACQAGTFRRSENHVFTFAAAGTYGVQVISDATGPTTGTYNLHIWKPSAPSCVTPSPSPTVSSTATPTATATASGTATSTPTSTATIAPTATATATSTPMETATSTPADTPTLTPTDTATATPTATAMATPSPGSFIVTNTDNSGAGSLRQAVLDANAAAGADTITFSSLFDTPQTITLGSVIAINGVNDTLTIAGPGAGLLTVSGNNAVAIFSISSGETTTISGMTITQAVTGAVSNSGNLTVIDCAFIANTDTSGGAITNSGVSLTVSGSTFSENRNTAPAVNGAGGAAIFSDSAATITNSTFTNNMTTGGAGGGAIDIRGMMTITGCTFSGNATTDDGQNSRGGAIYAVSNAQLTIRDTVITGNSTVRNGGGLYYSPNTSVGPPFLLIENSTVSHNIANSDNNTTGEGGGLYLSGTGSVSITGSTINGNTAAGNASGAGNGGGIDVSVPTTIANSTVSGNTAGRDGGGIQATGVSTVIVNIDHSTIVWNTAEGNAGGLSRASSTNPVNIHASLIANNTAQGTAPDLAGSVVSQGYNLIEIVTGATVIGEMTGNITGQDPRLDGVLRTNGGSTKTHALHLTSPALDAGDPAVFPATDQRGQLRPADGNGAGGPRSDIGAYERQSADVVISSMFDFDDDGRADLSVFRPMPDPAANLWYINRSSDNSFYQYEWGIETDKLAPADFDGDGKTDLTVWREEAADPDRATFYIFQTSDNTFRFEQFGSTGDVHSVVGDWDGDGKADPAVYRAAAGGSVFYYRPSSHPEVDFTAIPWGTAGDKPVRGDFDGDGRLDAAVFRQSDSIWYIRQSSTGDTRYENWGVIGDKLVPADYDGDGRTDVAVFRSGIWFILQSRNGQPRYEPFGLSTDILVPADYDGDGRADLAIYRDGIWYIAQTTSGFASFNFGLSTDKPIPNVEN